VLRYTTPLRPGGAQRGSARPRWLPAGAQSCGPEATDELSGVDGPGAEHDRRGAVVLGEVVVVPVERALGEPEERGKGVELLVAVVAP